MNLIKRLLVGVGFISAPRGGVVQVVPSPAPHEQYPEILHWKAGDEIRSAHTVNNFWFNLISITSEGRVYGQNRLDSHKFSQPLWMIIRDGENLSLRDRQINEELKNTNEYMQLIEQFNVAFAELQERDQKLKLVS